MGIFSNLKSALFGPSVDYAELVLDGAIIVDVRTPGEFSQGHSVGAINIPMGEFKSRINEMQGKEVILVCASGMRAAGAKAMLKTAGIKAQNAGSWTKLA